MTTGRTRQSRIGDVMPGPRWARAVSNPPDHPSMIILSHSAVGIHVNSSARTDASDDDRCHFDRRLDVVGRSVTIGPEFPTRCPPIGLRADRPVGLEPMSSSGVSGVWSLRIGKQEMPGHWVIVDHEFLEAP